MNPIDTEYGIFELQEKMRSGETTAHEIASSYLERIESIDRNGARLNSIIELNPEALSIASALDAERASGSNRGPLHGIPILLKDNIDTADGMQTTAGSLALEGHYAARDAGVVEKLRAAFAGIVIDVPDRPPPRVWGSFGYGFSREGDLAALKELADQRLYEDKRRSKGQRGIP